MPNFCAVVGCGSRANRDLNHFFRIPAIPSRGSSEFKKLKTERRQKWIIALRRKDLTEKKLKYATICDKHFITGRPAELQDYNHPDWVPSVLMGYETKSNSTSRLNKHNQIEVCSEANETILSASSCEDSDRNDSLENPFIEETNDSVVLSRETETRVENDETQTDSE